MNKHTFVFKKEILKKKLDSNKLFKIINLTQVIKKKLSTLITNKHIEKLFTKLINDGAQIKKLLGAGNGEFILINVNSKLKKKLESNPVKKNYINFKIEEKGVTIL